MESNNDFPEEERLSFDDSYNFDDDSLSQFTNEQELNFTWRGWKRPNPTLVQNNSHSGIVSLVELSAKKVARHIPFESVEKVFPPVPEQLQLRIAYWSFPESEEEIRLYSCLANGSGEEFSRGELLFKTRAITEALQIGFHLSTTISYTNPGPGGCGNLDVNASCLTNNNRMLGPGNLWHLSRPDVGNNIISINNINNINNQASSSNTLVHRINVNNNNNNNETNRLSTSANNSNITTSRTAAQSTITTATTTTTRLPSKFPLTTNVKFVVGVLFDRGKITSCTCNCSALSSWCSHVIALCLFRIHNSSLVNYRAPVSESLSRLQRDQLQKFAQYLISELPQQILPTAQRILDELLAVGTSKINVLSGAPDPTAGGSVHDIPTWFLDETLLHENLKRTLYKLCVPTPMVFSDVNYLSASAPPAALEWSNLLRPLRGREPEGMWNLLNIIAETFKKRDKNSVRLLKIITEECLNSERVLSYWYNTKVAEIHCKNILNRNSSNHITVSTQHACLNMYEEIVFLWCVCIMDPDLNSKERRSLLRYIRSQHGVLMEKIISIGKPSTSHITVTTSVMHLNQMFNNPHHHTANLANQSPLNSASVVNNYYPLKKFDLESFPGFKPAIETGSIPLPTISPTVQEITATTSGRFNCPDLSTPGIVDSNIQEHGITFVSSPSRSSPSSVSSMIDHVDEESQAPNIYANINTITDEQEVLYYQVIGLYYHGYIDEAMELTPTLAELLMRFPYNLALSPHLYRKIMGQDGINPPPSTSSTTTTTNPPTPLHPGSRDGSSSTTFDLLLSTNTACNTPSPYYVPPSGTNAATHPSPAGILFNVLHLDNLERTMLDRDIADHPHTSTQSSTVTADNQLFITKLTTGHSGKKSVHGGGIVFNKHYHYPYGMAHTKPVSSSNLIPCFIGGVGSAAAASSYSNNACYINDSTQQNKFLTYETTRKCLGLLNKTIFVCTVLLESRKNREGMTLPSIGTTSDKKSNLSTSKKSQSLKNIKNDIVLPPSSDVVKPSTEPAPNNNNNTNYDPSFLALKLGISTLKILRPPASSKALEVKLANQESILYDILMKVPLNDNQIWRYVCNESLNFINRSSCINANFSCILPLTLATLFFEMLRSCGVASLEPSSSRETLEKNRLKTSRANNPNENICLPAVSKSESEMTNSAGTIPMPPLSSHPRLDLMVGLAALEMRTNISEMEYPLLIEGMRRRRGDLAMLLLLTFRDDIHKLAQIMDKFLDPQLHHLCKRPLPCFYYTGNLHFIFPVSVSRTTRSVSKPLSNFADQFNEMKSKNIRNCSQCQSYQVSDQSCNSDNKVNGNSNNLFLNDPTKRGPINEVKVGDESSSSSSLHTEEPCTSDYNLPHYRPVIANDVDLDAISTLNAADNNSQIDDFESTQDIALAEQINEFLPPPAIPINCDGIHSLSSQIGEEGSQPGLLERDNSLRDDGFEGCEELESVYSSNNSVSSFAEEEEGGGVGALVDVEIESTRSLNPPSSNLDIDGRINQQALMIDETSSIDLLTCSMAPNPGDISLIEDMDSSSIVGKNCSVFSTLPSEEDDDDGSCIVAPRSLNLSFNRQEGENVGPTLESLLAHHGVLTTTNNFSASPNSARVEVSNFTSTANSSSLSSSLNGNLTTLERNVIASGVIVGGVNTISIPAPILPYPPTPSNTGDSVTMLRGPYIAAPFDGMIPQMNSFTSSLVANEDLDDDEDDIDDPDETGLVLDETDGVVVTDLESELSSNFPLSKSGNHHHSHNLLQQLNQQPAKPSKKQTNSRVSFQYPYTSNAHIRLGEKQNSIDSSSPPDDFNETTIPPASVNANVDEAPTMDDAANKPHTVCEDIVKEFNIAQNRIKDEATTCSTLNELNYAISSNFIIRTSLNAPFTKDNKESNRLDVDKSIDSKSVDKTNRNQLIFPSEAGAHYMFEFAKSLLVKAGGNSNSNLFLHATFHQVREEPHEALHFCAFQIGMYALGLHNRVSPNWLSRTYSSHVSWITGQALEIGATAIHFLIDTWQAHLTPSEAVSLADKASNVNDNCMPIVASQLALSCLNYCHALSIHETQRALIQCKDLNSEMLEKGCLAVENVARNFHVPPEVLFEVSRHWFWLFISTVTNQDIPKNWPANSSNYVVSMSNNNACFVLEPPGPMYPPPPPGLNFSNFLEQSQSENERLPTWGNTFSLTTSTLSPLPLSSSGNTSASVVNLHNIVQTFPGQQTRQTAASNQHIFLTTLPSSLMYPPSYPTVIPPPSYIIFQPTQQLTRYYLPPGLPFHHHAMVPNLLLPPQHRTPGGHHPPPPPPPPPIFNFTFNNCNNNIYFDYPSSNLQSTSMMTSSSSCKLENANSCFVPNILPILQIPHNFSLDGVNVNTTLTSFMTQPMGGATTLTCSYFQNFSTNWASTHSDVNSNERSVNVSQNLNLLCTPSSISHMSPTTTVSYTMSPEGHMSNKILPEESSTSTVNELSKSKNMYFLESAFRIGMMALELLGKKIQDERPQSKYAPNPPYGDDVKWLAKVSALLGQNKFEQFCTCVLSCIQSPFILHDILLDYLALLQSKPVQDWHLRNANFNEFVQPKFQFKSRPTIPTEVSLDMLKSLSQPSIAGVDLNFPTSSSTPILPNMENAIIVPLKNKCLQMYSQWATMRLAHLTSEEYDDFLNLLNHAKEAFLLKIPHPPPCSSSSSNPIQMFEANNGTVVPPLFVSQFINNHHPSMLSAVIPVPFQAPPSYHPPDTLSHTPSKKLNFAGPHGPPSSYIYSHVTAASSGHLTPAVRFNTYLNHHKNSFPTLPYTFHHQSSSSHVPILNYPPSGMICGTSASSSSNAIHKQQQQQDAKAHQQLADGMTKFTEFVNSLRRNKSVKKDLWQKIMENVLKN